MRYSQAYYCSTVLNENVTAKWRSLFICSRCRWVMRSFGCQSRVESKDRVPSSRLNAWIIQNMIWENCSRSLPYMLWQLRYTVRHQIVSQVFQNVFWEFRSCTAAFLLPRQARGTLIKLFTKPAKRPDGGERKLLLFWRRHSSGTRTARTFFAMNCRKYSQPIYDEC